MFLLRLLLNVGAKKRRKEGVVDCFSVGDE